MKKIYRIFIGACCGIPFGLVGMTTGSLFAFVFNKIIGRKKIKLWHIVQRLQI